MIPLQPDHIIDLFVLVDDTLPEIPKPQGGRPTLLTNSEIITILLWNAFTVRSKTLKDIHRWAIMYHKSDFPCIPKYSAFIDHCHRIIPLLHRLLEYFLADHAPLRFMDSTMLEVCKLVRTDSHKVAKKIAEFGKNHQGWHYGFKLHASIDQQGRLTGIAFTPANIYDAQMMPNILNQHTRIAVGDTLYGARVMREKIWKHYGAIIITPPHPKQKTKIVNWWQYILLTARPKIESVFDYLKEHMGIVTSFPRSVNGYLLHYLRILLGYQLMVG